jgi:transcriptional regulator with XRE-family HTH domain
MLGKKISSPSAAFGLVLRDIRKLRGMSQEALALEADLQRNYISLIERGINQPTISTIFKLATALGVKPSVIVARTEERTDQIASNKSR